MYRRSRSIFGVVLAFAGSMRVAEAGTIIYVDTQAKGPIYDGMNWCHGYLQLDEALAIARAGDTIRVAMGIYTPDATGLSDPREATFQLISGVALEGGYAGCGTWNPDERNIPRFETLLSGDLAQNDVSDLNDPTHAENSYHVVVASQVDSTSVLDGFVITGGIANGDFWLGYDLGAGIFNMGGSPTLKNCTIRGCMARLKLAPSNCCNVHDEAGCDRDTCQELVCELEPQCCTSTWSPGCAALAKLNCDCSGRLSGSGGGMFNSDEASPTLTNCVFLANVAANWGGGMYNAQFSHPTLTGCHFIGNTANTGAAIINFSASSVIAVDCLFKENGGVGHGGAIFNQTGMFVTRLSSCRFTDNFAGNGGGAVWDDSWGMTVTDCIFEGNSANVGGAFYDRSSTFFNCLFKSNRATRLGGGLFINGGRPSAVNNCTFVQNICTEHGGGGISYWPISDLTVQDSILWNNLDAGGADETAQIHTLDEANTAAISGTCIDGLTGLLGGSGNIGEDPQFAPGPSGCYYLSQKSSGQATKSSCVDAGNGLASELGLDTVTTRTDEANDTGIIDMGFHYPITGLPIVMGDFDRDLRLTLRDYAGLQRCFGGQGLSNVSPCCRIFDFEPDFDVDLDDVQAFSSALVGPSETMSRSATR